MRSKEHLPLLIGISLPVIVTIAVGLSIWIPTLYAVPPAYDFLYSTNDGYQVDQQYVVENERLVKRPARQYPKDAYPPVYNPVLFYHDTKANKTRSISFEEAKKLKLNASVLSPDGFEVVSGQNNNGFFPMMFGGMNDDRSHYLRGHGTAYKLSVSTTEMDYYTFRLLGWVVQ